jgi:hypothetical protein
MTPNTNQPIDFSQAKEPPQSLKQDQEADVVQEPEVTGQTETDPDLDETSRQVESAENAGERQMTSAHIPGAGLL